MGKVVDYKILKAGNPAALSAYVKRELEEGYQPLGPATQIMTSDRNPRTLFMQTMVKEGEETIPKIPSEQPDTIRVGQTISFRNFPNVDPQQEWLVTSTDEGTVKFVEKKPL